VTICDSNPPPVRELVDEEAVLARLAPREGRSLHNA
jgi:hypothetical protein